MGRFIVVIPFGFDLAAILAFLAGEHHHSFSNEAFGISEGLRGLR
jgi:hypothetical protein